MTLKAYRVTKAKFAETAFDGEGAYLHGGRWNPVGVAVVYLADSLALAVLETLVHLERPRALDAYAYFEVAFASELALAVTERDLPPDWHADPEPASTVAIGEAWLKSKASLLLRVPSVVVPQGYNYLLNPAHPDRDRVVIDGPHPLRFDARLR